MKRMTCLDCRKQLPVAEIFLYKGQEYCAGCLDVKVNSGIKITQNEVVGQIDDTICYNCGLDNGDVEFAKITHFPFCQKCTDFVRNRPFPRWIKLSAVIAIVIVLFGFFYNAKYFYAHLNIRQAEQAFWVGDFEKAYQKYDMAAQRLPHLLYLQIIADFYRGMYFLNEGDSQKALTLFMSYKSYYPDDTYVDMLIPLAEASVAFDVKDYQKSYSINKKYYESYPESADAILGRMASAACLYATTQKQQYKDETNEMFQAALSLEMSEEGRERVRELIQRMKHRMFSREIITEKEYFERFPDGWKGEVK